MTQLRFILLVFVGCFAGSLSTVAQTAMAERLYVFDCGEAVTIDVSRWSPGVDVGKPFAFSGQCYLIRHKNGLLLWDTGVPDSLAAKTDGEPPADPRALHWRRRVTLAAQLDQLSIKPDDIRFLAISHAHPDHIGNVESFPKVMLLVQKAEYESPNPFARFKPEHPVTKLEGDHDIFGDGSVMLFSTPGHTPGHQSLLVRLRDTGAVLLSGDMVHFRSNWDNRRVPSININGDQTSASMQRMSEILAREKAQLWINHDKAQRDTLRLSPQFYE